MNNNYREISNFKYKEMIKGYRLKKYNRYSNTVKIFYKEIFNLNKITYQMKKLWMKYTKVIFTLK